MLNELNVLWILLLAVAPAPAQTKPGISSPRASIGSKLPGCPALAPAPAPLPAYQRKYSGERYPEAEQQQVLQAQHYHYQAHDPLVR